MGFEVRKSHLPDFPWDQLAPFAERARSHSRGIIDLSIGTPVDPVPQLVQDALAEASDAPGYPTTIGLPELRAAFINWLWRNHLVTGLTPEAVLPTIGSKELVAWLPTLLGLNARDVVAIPGTAYPTYDVGARLAGCAVVTADTVEQMEAARAAAESAGRNLAMVWLNSPSNPPGAVASADELRATVNWARAHSILLVSDECYIDLGWESTPVSLLHPDVCGADHSGLLVVHSLSKRSNLAGYRAGLVAGDRQVIAALLEVRKHSGMMLPTPVQRAAIAALNDDTHVAAQRAVYAARRKLARSALAAAGFRIEHSQAGLYLWATRDEDCWSSVSWLADRGVLVAPGSFYGSAGASFVRVAMTASDERFAELGDRLR